MNYIIVASIIIYPILALFVIKRIINKQNNKNSLDALDYYKEPKRYIYYHYEENSVIFDIDNFLLPLHINKNIVKNEKYVLSNVDDALIENDKFSHQIICLNHSLIGNDFRDIGGLKADDGFIAFNKIYRIANVCNLNKQQSEELMKTNYKTIFNLNNKIKLKNNYLNINKNNSISISVLSNISNVIPFLKQDKLDYYTWYAHMVYDNIIDEKKNIGRLLKKIMKSEKSVIIQDGDGHYQTEIIIMLILMMLGVDKKDIANEYSISNVSLKKDTTLKSDIHNLAVISNPLVINKLINNIDGTYENRDKFFEDLEISKELIDEFKSKMIVKA